MGGKTRNVPPISQALIARSDLMVRGAYDRQVRVAS